MPKNAIITAFYAVFIRLRRIFSSTFCAPTINISSLLKTKPSEAESLPKDAHADQRHGMKDLSDGLYSLNGCITRKTSDIF